MARRGAAGLLRAVLPMAGALVVLVAGCTGAGSSAPTTSPPPATLTSTVGTSTSTITSTTVVGTVTVPGTATTVTVTSTPTRSSTAPAGPPPATKEPKPEPGTCPYLSDEAVKDANGQHTGQTSIIATKPYPVCVFTRSDGGYLATTRIVVAKTAAQASAAVDQHVPRGQSNPAALSGGWAGGAMGNLDGVPGYPEAASVYAVSKGRIAVIAISNQAQSIKGRQMVEQIVQNLDL